MAGAVLLVGGALTWWAYVPAVGAGFVFDDEPNIVDAVAVHWEGVSWEGVERVWAAAHLPVRFVANVTFALNHVVGGLDPRGYHLVNVLIHLMVGVVLVWVGWWYLRVVRVSRGEVVVMWAVVVPVVLFWLHPLNTQSVTYVVQRMSSLAALFSLVAFGLYLVGRSRGAWVWYVGAVVAWLLALGSKENAVLLPLVVGTYEACFHRAEWRRVWLRWAPGRRLLVLAGVVLLLVGGLLVLVVVVGDAVGWTTRWPLRDFTGWERVLTQARVQVFYLTLLLWPVPGRLTLDHDFAVSRSLWQPWTTLPAVVFWLGVLIAVVWLARRRPLYGFPLLAYLEWHLIESGPVNLELVFEHRMYLPLTMLVLLAAVVLAELRPPLRQMAVVGALAIALPLAAATRARNHTWADPIAFHYDVARKAPNKWRPQYNLGTILGKAGRVEEAQTALLRAVQLKPDHSESHNQLGNTYLLTDRPGLALAEYRRAVALNPGNAEALYNLAITLEQMGRAPEAVEYYRRFVAAAPPWLRTQVAQVRRRLRALEHTP